MKIASFSLLRLPFTVSATRHRFFSAFIVAAGRHQNPNNVSRKLQQPNKNLLKARETINKQFSTLAPILSQEDKPHLSHDQAVGTVASSQANFMRVIVQHIPQETSIDPSGSFSKGSGEIGVELLCVVKAVLKKIKRRVLVGDKVLVGSIDWVDRHGAIENVFQRKTEILDPPVANVDHLLVLFSMDQPKIEPFSLTRFLVEAESTGIPLTLALNKSELVSQEEIKAWKSRLRSWSCEPIFCSVDSKRGLDILQFIMREQTSVIVGPSGVGKSSLINALRGNKHILGAVEEQNWFDPITYQDKSTQTEENTMKQILEILTTLNTKVASMDDKIQNLDEKIQKLEARSQQHDYKNTELQQHIRRSEDDKIPELEGDVGKHLKTQTNSLLNTAAGSTSTAGSTLFSSSPSKLQR